MTPSAGPWWGRSASPGLIAALVPVVATVVVIALCVVARRQNSREARTAATVMASALLAAVAVATATTHIGIAGLPTAAVLFGPARSRIG